MKFLNVGEDVSVGRAQGSIVGRRSANYLINKLLYLTVAIFRGLAGTVLVYKIAGALANQGASLDDVYNLAEWVASRMGTVGVGLDHCHVCLAYIYCAAYIHNEFFAVGPRNRAFQISS